MNVKPEPQHNSDKLPIAPTSSQPCSNTNVGSRIASCPPKRLTCIDKHWSEMTANERVEAGPFLCFVKPDEFDKEQGKFVEFMILYKNYEEYEELKKFAIETGRWVLSVQPK